MRILIFYIISALLISFMICSDDFSIETNLFADENNTSSPLICTPASLDGITLEGITGGSSSSFNSFLSIAGGSSSSLNSSLSSTYESIGAGSMSSFNSSLVKTSSDSSAAPKRKKRKINPPVKKISFEDFDFGTLTPEKAVMMETIKDIILTNKRGKLKSLVLDDEMLTSLKDHHRSNQLPGYTLMYLAAISDNDEAIKWLYSKGCDLNSYMGKGSTPLQVAVGHNNLKAVKTLLSFPRVNPYASSVFGRTALMSAVRNGQLEIINEFLNVPGINLKKLLNAVDLDGRSVLEMAYIGKCEISNDGNFLFSDDSRLFYEKANDAVIDRLLHFSEFLYPNPEFLVRLFSFDWERFKFLAKKLPNFAIRALKLIDLDLIFLAIKENDLELLKALHMVVPATFTNSSGSLPIHLAASIGATEVVIFYLKEYSIPIDVKNSLGLTIEDIAKINGYAELENAITLFHTFKVFDFI